MEKVQFPRFMVAAEKSLSLIHIFRPGESVLIPRARMGSPLLREALCQGGISVLDVPVYDVEMCIRDRAL